MTTGSVTYSGLLLSKGAIYTQKRGMTPDRVQVRMIPQQSSIATVGDLTLQFDTEIIVIKDCLADKSHIWLTDNGFVGTIIFEDRRWRWSRYERFSAHFNARNPNGDLIEATRASLRDILQAAFIHIGESSADVSRVPSDFYPEVDAQCVECDKLIDELTSNYGYVVCLGFSDDSVSVWPEGDGDALPTGVQMMAYSEEVDPPTPPWKVQVCFGPSMAQARFKLVAYGKDTDGELKPIDDLSYTPSGGWASEPLDMPNVNNQFGSEAWKLARQTVYKVYMIDTFSDGTLNYPDGSGALDDISQVLPLFDKLLEVVPREDTVYHPPVRVYGAYRIYSFPAMLTGELEDEVQEPWEFDHYRGMITFENQMYLLTGTGDDKTREPADLYLEAAFRIRDSFNQQWIAYSYEQIVNANGAGYYSHHQPNMNARTIVSYDDTHSATGTVTNQSILDAYAASIVNSAAGLYRFSNRSMIWYNRPMSSLRLDGMTSQIRHCISDGEDGEPGHYTIASQGTEFDILSRSSQETKAASFVSGQFRDRISMFAAQTRTVKGND